MQSGSPNEHSMLSQEADRFQRDIESLRTQYDQYFQGVIRQEPYKLHQKIQKMVQKFSGLAIQNARLKFKIQQSIARFNTYSRYWARILREIEEGRHQRDKFMARLQEGQPIDTSKSKPTSDGKTTIEDAFQKLYTQYVGSQKNSGNTAIKNLSFSQFKKNIQKQRLELSKKTGKKNVWFKVVEEDGKTKLKAIALKKTTK